MPVAVVSGEAPSTPQSFAAKPDKEKFPPIPAGTYRAEVARMRYRDRATDPKFPTWKKWDSEISFGFKIIDGDYQGRWFWEDVPFTLDKGSKLRLWLQELTITDDLPDGYSFDTDDVSDWEGLDCRIRLNQYKTKRGDVRNGVQDVLRPLDEDYEENPF